MGPTIKSDQFGIHSNGTPVTRYVLENANNIKVEILSLGGIVSTLVVPDKHGNLVDIVTGFSTVAEYELNPAYFGAIIGRVANRISGGKFELDGQKYNLATNRAPSHLHGGNVGFDKKLWSGAVEGSRLTLTYTSPDGEEGYPGTLQTNVVYELTSDNELYIHYTATCDKPTIINLTNHTYFNLAGHKSGFIGDHVLSVNSDQYLEKDEHNVASGVFVDVSGTPYDLRAPTRLGDRLKSVGTEPPGYDHNFCINHPPGEARGRCHAATLTHPLSGRGLEVYTDQPGVQVYTGNYLNGLGGKDGAVYGQHSCIALETQNYPDAVNHENFPSCVLRPGGVYEHKTWYKFIVTP